jgi:hypothetical protein
MYSMLAPNGWTWRNAEMIPEEGERDTSIQYQLNWH